MVHFSASIIQPLLGYDAIDLLACFNSLAPGSQNAVVLEDAELEEFCRIFRQIQQVLEQEPYGRETSVFDNKPVFSSYFHLRSDFVFIIDYN